MGRRKKGLQTSGWVVLDKPLGLSSTQAVSKVRWLFNAQKAGHAGTLDPLATGLLAVALGEATKTVPFIMDGEKVYQFTVKFGEETNTDDAEGEVVNRSDYIPTSDEIKAIIPQFLGAISQRPPAFSAIKINGEPAYKIARQGEEVEIKERIVDIYSFDMISFENGCGTFELECGKGTYVRSLARDMARALGSYGHVIGLRRLAVGPFSENDMISLDNLEEMRHKTPDFAEQAFEGQFDDILLPVQTALDDIPALAVSTQDAVRLKRGQPVLLRGREAPLICDTVSVSSGGCLVALGEIDKGMLKPKRIFNLGTNAAK